MPGDIINVFHILTIATESIRASRPSRYKPTLNFPHHIERMKPAGAKSRFHSPSKLDLARCSRKFRNSYSTVGTEIHAFGTYMQAHLPEMRSYWFRAPTMRFIRLLSFSFSLFLSLSVFPPCLAPLSSFSTFPASSILSIFLFYLFPRRSFYLPCRFICARAAPTPRWHSFLLAHFYRRIFRSQFVGRQEFSLPFFRPFPTHYPLPILPARGRKLTPLWKQRRKTIIARLTITI